MMNRTTLPPKPVVVVEYCMAPPDATGEPVSVGLWELWS